MCDTRPPSRSALPRLGYVTLLGPGRKNDDRLSHLCTPFRQSFDYRLIGTPAYCVRSAAENAKCFKWD